MGSNNLRNKKPKYVNSFSENACENLISEITSCINNFSGCFNEIVVLCIGTDRVTGDSLGPLTGAKLQSVLAETEKVMLFGTLDSPVHAKNIAETVESIYESMDKPLVIAVDACLGAEERIGCLQIGEGTISPGSAVNKKLKPVGDIFITGVVNRIGGEDVLRNTRLFTVMIMAEVIASGLAKALETVV